MPNAVSGNELGGNAPFSTQDHFGMSGAQMQNHLSNFDRLIQSPGGLDNILNSPSFDFQGFERNVDMLGKHGPDGLGDGIPIPRHDRDGDGDHDQFDRTIILAERYGNPLSPDERDNLAAANWLHERIEDFKELADNNPNNDSFFDGANGSGNETSTPMP
jgi:hypothetical protein